MKGRALELAIGRAARNYRKENLCILIKQEVRTIRDGANLRMVGAAPVDFLGCLYGGRALARECKETDQASFPLANLDADQRYALNCLHDFDADVALIIDFSRVGEVYSIPYLHILDFLKSPYRASLSLDWCRAYGLLLPEISRDEADGPRHCLFLEGKPHADHDAAFARVTAERATSPVLDLDKAADIREAKPPRVSRRSLERKAYGEMMGRQPDKRRDPEAHARWVRDEFTLWELRAQREAAVKARRGIK